MPPIPAPPDLSDSLLERYSRHIMLADFDVDGQQRLSQTTLLIVGLGGLGTIASLYLASAGIGRLLLCDDDTVARSNLQRQILYRDSDIGHSKVAVAKERLQRVNPHCQIQTIDDKFSDKNSAEHLAAADGVLDCSDNFATRHAVNRACVIHKKPLFWAAATQYDGQISTFDPKNSTSPCYNCLFSEDTTAPDTPCALLGVLSPTLGLVGSWQAAEAIKYFALKNNYRSLSGRLVLIDSRDNRLREIALPRDPHCRVCQV